MRKSVKFLMCMFLVVIAECGQCPDTIQFSVRTVNAEYTYDTEHVKSDVISPKAPSFSITLEGDVPVLCKKMLHITEMTYHFYGDNISISEIEPGTFENQNINSQLRLSSNYLTIIKKGTFKNIPITDLDLTYNKIRTIEVGALEDLPKLTILNLGRNNIKEFHPNSIQLTPKLLFFDISQNKIETLEENHFSFMSKERNVGVGLAQNELSKIHPKAFEGIDVFTFNLSHNHLTHIPKEVFVKNQLHYLDIAYNDLTHLDQEFFDMNTTILRDVQLEGNNFDEETLRKLVPFMEIIEKNREENRRWHQFDDTIRPSETRLQ